MSQSSLLCLLSLFSIAQAKFPFFQLPNWTNNTCINDLKTIYQAAKLMDPDALKMLDANFKFPKGVTSGNFAFQGRYEECRSINGKYCLGKMRPSTIVQQFGAKEGVPESYARRLKSEFTTPIEVCVPRSCSVDDLQLIFQENNLFSVVFSEGLCSYKAVIKFELLDYLITLLFVSIIGAVIASTFYHLRLEYCKMESNIFISFSLVYNWRQFLKYNVNNNLNCMNGIRVLSILHIVIGHVFMINAWFTSNKLYYITQFRKSYICGLVNAGTYAVDTFFTMSGTLGVYIYLKHSENRKITTIQIYFHRLMRLLPLLIITLLIHIKAFTFYTNPYWTFSAARFLGSCRSNYWMVLLFISNFFPMEHTCILHAWYLSADTQMYLLLPLIVYFLQRNRKIAFSGIFTTCLMCFIYTAIVCVVYNLGYLQPWNLTTQGALYTGQNTFARMPPWLVGNCFGYILYKKYFENLSKRIHFYLWLISIMILLFGWFSTVHVLTYEGGLFKSVFLNCFGRTLWSCGICLVIFNCWAGHGGLVNIFLSHPFFLVTMKLCYSMYLIHMVILTFTLGNRTHPVYFNLLEMFFDICGSLVLCLVCSLILYLTCEAPFSNLLSTVTKRPADVK